MRKRTLILVMLLMATGWVTACSTGDKQAGGAQTETQSAVLIAEGRLFPEFSMDQIFTTAGQIEKVFISNGDQVVADQILANIYVSPDANAALARAQEETLAAQQAIDELAASADVALTQGRLSVIQAQQKLDAAENLLNTEYSVENRAERDAAKAALLRVQATQEVLEANAGIDPDRLAAAQARLASAKGALDSALAFIEAHKLIATISGSVIDLDLQPGLWVTAGQPVMTLADLSQWVVKTDNLSEVEVMDVTLGQEVEVVFDAIPDMRFSGEVVKVNNRFEEKRGDITFTVTIRLTQVDPAFRWGMTAAVYFKP